LKRILKPYTNIIEIVGQAQNGAEAIEIIDNIKPDLIFLDIQMPEFNGFEVVERIQHNPLIIFVTAYDEFALKAFDTNSIDYLLKPVDSRRLKKALGKLRDFTAPQKIEFENQMQQMLSYVKNPSLKRIHVKVADRILLVDVKDIYFLSALDKYVEVHLYDKGYLITKSLTTLTAELPADDFVRIHRSTVINLNYVDEIVKMFNGRYRVRMKDKFKSEFPVSRSSRSKLGLNRPIP